MTAQPVANFNRLPADLLERRPDARTVRVEDLLGEIRRGRVRVPEFQRAFRWEREDARELLDSIYRGYPIGTLLLWETAAEPQVVHFGPLAIDAPQLTNAWWVVDGQQRVVSLARVLLATHPSTDDFSLYFDLDESRFVLASTILKRPQDDLSRWLPLAVVQDSEQLFRWMLDQKPDGDRRELAIRVGKRIREYEIPAYVVHTDSEETLRQIFGRTNNSGKQLKSNEVFDALHGARLTGKPSRISDIVEDVQELGFGRVEAKILYRLLRVLTGADVTERGERGVLRLSDEEAQTAYAVTAAAAKAVVQFLKRDVGIPHYDLLPYKQPLVTLGKFFHHYPSPTARSRQLLARWLWRGALNGVHRGDTVSTRRALDQISGDDEEFSVQRMLKHVASEPTEWPSVSESFNFRFAHGKLQTLALVALGPRDLVSQEPLNAATAFDVPTEDIPLPDIIAGGAPGGNRGVANRLLHVRMPGLRRALVAVQSKNVLDSHAISAEAHSALVEGDIERFLSLRSATLEVRFRDFFEQRAQWRDSDRPSVPALVISDED